MQVTAYYPKTPTFTLTRKNIDFSGFDYKAIDGTYLNSETNVSFAIQHTAGLAYEVTNGDTKMKAILLSKDEMVINDYGYRIKIGKKENTKVGDLLLTSGRIQNVRFSRVR
jgi:hypothetical protein